MILLNKGEYKESNRLVKTRTIFDKLKRGSQIYEFKCDSNDWHLSSLITFNESHIYSIDKLDIVGNIIHEIRRDIYGEAGIVTRNIVLNSTTGSINADKIFYNGMVFSSASDEYPVGKYNNDALKEYLQTPHNYYDIEDISKQYSTLYPNYPSNSKLLGLIDIDERANDIIKDTGDKISVKEVVPMLLKHM